MSDRKREQFREIRCDLPDEGAQIGLIALMTGISEECWCAGWMSGLEYDLWQAKRGMSYGQGVITDRQSDLLRLLSEEAGGWWRWTEDGPQFVPLDEWRDHISGLAA